MHVELQEHLVEVVLDGLRAEEELRGDAAVATAAGRELCDAPLLRRQLVERAWIAGAGRLTGRVQLLTRPLCQSAAPITSKVSRAVRSWIRDSRRRFWRLRNLP